MTRPATIVLSAGGIRSLVALAAVRAEPDHGSLILLHLSDGRANGAVRAEYVHRQARQYKLGRTLVAPLPAVSAGLGTASSDDDDDEADQTGARGPALVRPQLLLTACAFAVQFNAQRIIWPAQANGLFAQAAALNEQLVLARHLAQHDNTDPPPIETPLLDLTDQQVIELGGQLGVPWALAWTCTKSDATPCGACPGCRRRVRGFEAAGVLDPAADPPMKKAG